MQGHHRNEGDPDDRRLEDPRRLCARVLGDRRRSSRRPGRGHVGKDEPRRVRDGQLERELGLRSGQESLVRRSGARRIVWRLRRRGRCGRGAVRARHRHRRIDPAACGAHRGRRHEADVRPRTAVGRGRVRVFARSGRSFRQHRRGCGDRVRGDLRQGPERRDDGRRFPERRSSAGPRRGRERTAPRRSKGVLRGQGHGAWRRAGGPRGACCLREGRREARGGLALADRSRPSRLLHHPAGRGVCKPRSIRRRSVRLAGRRSRPRRDVSAHAWEGLRTRGEAAHDPRHICALGRLLRRVLRESAEGSNPHQSRIRSRLR